MKKSLFTLIVMLVSLLSYSHAVEIQTLEKNGVSLEIPKDWKADTAADPIVHIANDPLNTTAVIILREVKADMGVKDLQEYFEFKLQKISGGWQDARLSEAKTGPINGSNTRWIEGTAVMVDPKGVKIPSNVRLATIEGKDYFYLILMTEKEAIAPKQEGLLLGIFKSIKAL